MQDLKKILLKLNRLEDCILYPERGTNTRPIRLIDDIREILKAKMSIRCICKNPHPIIKVSENGVSAYCRICSKQYVKE